MYSAADIKGNKPIKIRAPREGTKIRRLYDLLVVNKFEPMTLKRLRIETGTRQDTIDREICQLTDFYDMEIVRVARATYLFAGFVDYNGRMS